jgi:3-hydroxymyristoyl/3-hydroxydecanoyl-(acyl carrier protein) dehydratase
VLPHAYPFRVVEPLAGVEPGAKGPVTILVSLNAAWSRGNEEVPPFFAVEALAQASILALSGRGATADAPRGGLLAGLEDVRFHLPLRAGDRLEAEATLLGRLGQLIKVRCELRRDGELAVEAGLLLALAREDATPDDASR